MIALEIPQISSSAPAGQTTTHGVRVLAFYLPQFHPVPENDAWWGRGFTEWTNVTKARPLFRGHYQPHLPSDLGFYDLRVPETREAQADMARQAGIDGFCYYHYWFNGRRLLDRPFNEVLSSGRPDFPFCLCWANENWTRTWDGGDHQILVQQAYSPEDDRSHINALLPAFKDSRYIRFEGKALMLVYRASQLPVPRQTTDIWREEADRAGVGPLYLCRVESFLDESTTSPEELGFDAAVQFLPDWSQLGPALRRRWKAWGVTRRLRLTSMAYRRHRMFDYEDVITRMLTRPEPAYRRFPCVTPSWDNTARKANDGMVFRNASPDLYGDWLAKMLERERSRHEDESLVFVNAWNEWGEGNHLEPCQRWGHAYLDATRTAVDRAQRRG